MPRWLKVTIGITATLVILAGVTIFIFYRMLSASLPVYSGEIRSDKLKGTVTVYRDSFAIPYIIAENDEDAAFALGYLHAQERLFTMDLFRRAGEGRLSEVLGPNTVSFDKMFLTSGIKRAAQKNYLNLDSETKEILESYTAGINNFIEDAKGNYPVEFDVLGYDPELWTPVHSLIIIRMIAWELNISWWVDIMFTHLAQKLGKDKVMEILPDYPQNAPYVIPAALNDYPPVSLELVKNAKAFRSFIGMTGTHVGSNNWVISPGRSKSGKPIIANDPHLAFRSPGLWYTAVIHTGGSKTAGVTLPGAPGVVIGKNENIAWTMTNIMADDADFYIEKLDSSKSHYLFNGNWIPLKAFKDTIKVKDSLDVILDTYETHRGPIVSGIHPYSFLYPGKPQRDPPISMRWTGNDVSNELKAAIGINKASDWNEFKQAASLFTVPGQNFVYADKNGNIGYYFGVKLPVRKHNNPSFIYDGTTDAYDWTGYLPESEKPVLFNPDSGFIATANNKVSSRFSYHISNLWEPSSRIDRINQLLSSKRKHSVKDYKRYQMDITSPYAEEITKYVLKAFEGIKITDTNMNLTLELFREWNYEMNAFTQIPAIYTVFLNKLLENIYKDELGEDLFNEFVFVANVPYRSLLKLLENPASSWFNNVNTEQRETRDEIIRKSLADALSLLEREHGKNLKLWQWGNFHKVIFRHAFSGVSPLLDKFINTGPFPVGGDGTTIFNTEYMFRDPIERFPQFNHQPFENVLGPSMRFIFDFAEPDVFYIIMPTGQSGHVLSSHYRDMSHMWLEGAYIRVRTDIESIQENKGAILTFRR